MTGRRLAVAVIFVFLMQIAIFSCATSSLPDNASAKQKRDALCLDAVTALAMADSALSTGVAGSQASAYWLAFRLGATIGISNYCPADIVSKTQVATK